MGKWSKDEKEKALYLNTILGNRYAFIALLMPGKTRIQVKSFLQRFHDKNKSSEVKIEGK